MHSADVDDDALTQRMVVFGGLKVQLELLAAPMCVPQVERIAVRQQRQVRRVDERFVRLVQRPDLAALAGRQLLALGQLIHLVLETFLRVLVVHTLSAAGGCAYVTAEIVGRVI